MASTKIRRTTAPNALNPNQRILILPNCNAAAKCPYWLGALNNVTTIGCGINALMFMEEIDANNAQEGFKQALQGEGTPFRHVVKRFDDKVKTLNPSVSVKEIKYSIDTKKHLQGFYWSVFNEMPENSCIIVKYNRTNESQRLKNLTPGHYVVLSKEAEMGVNKYKLFTYEPLTSTLEKCDKRELKNLNVSDNFFNAMSVNQGYDSASILGIDYTMYGGNKEENISKENEKVLSDKIFNLGLLDYFVKQKCRRIGGRTIKDKKRNLSKKSKKLKKSKKSKKSKKLKKSKKSKNNTNKSKK